MSFLSSIFICLWTLLFPLFHTNVSQAQIHDPKFKYSSFVSPIRSSSVKMGLMLLELTVKPINRGRNVVLAAMSNLIVDDDQEEAEVEYKYK